MLLLLFVCVIFASYFFLTIVVCSCIIFFLSFFFSRNVSFNELPLNVNYVYFVWSKVVKIVKKIVQFSLFFFFSPHFTFHHSIHHLPHTKRMECEFQRDFEYWINRPIPSDPCKYTIWIECTIAHSSIFFWASQNQIAKAFHFQNPFRFAIYI